MTVGNFACGRQESRALCASARPDRLRLLATKLPRPLRFLGVGGLGLLTDITLFTLILMATLPCIAPAKPTAKATATKQ